MIIFKEVFNIENGVLERKVFDPVLPASSWPLKRLKLKNAKIISILSERM